MKRFWISVLFIFFAGCGKNDAVRPVAANNSNNPNSPIYQAPMPPTGGGYPPPGMGGGGGFQPQLPPGMPPQYVPFLPVEQYFRRTPQLTQIFVNVWADWRMYAYQNRYNVYDFNAFWFDYCPSNWQTTQLAPIYNYIDQSYYSWTSPGMSYCDGGCDADYFWQNYSGMSYSGGYCDYGC